MWVRIESNIPSENRDDAGNRAVFVPFCRQVDWDIHCRMAPWPIRADECEREGYRYAFQTEVFESLNPRKVVRAVKKLNIRIYLVDGIDVYQDDLQAVVKPETVIDFTDDYVNLHSDRR